MTTLSMHRCVFVTEVALLADTNNLRVLLKNSSEKTKQSRCIFAFPFFLASVGLLRNWVAEQQNVKRKINHFN